MSIIAVQLYTLRHFQEPFEALLEHVAAAGYQGVETVGTQGLSAKEVKAALNANGLTVVSGHVPLSELETNLEQTAAFHQEIGNDTLIVPHLSSDLYDDTAESWQKLGQQLGEIGARLKDLNLRLAYHNHAFEMPEIDGKRAIDWLLESAGTEQLAFEPDLAWMVRGGVDPLELLGRYQGRCKRVHIKDIAPQGENTDEDGWADVGFGTLDWDTLLPAAARAGAEAFIVEHDKPKDPLVTIRRSAGFLKPALARLLGT